MSSEVPGGQARRRVAFLAAAVCFLLFLLDESSFQHELTTKQNLRRAELVNQANVGTTATTSSTLQIASASTAIPINVGLELFEQRIIGANTSASSLPHNFTSTVFVHSATGIVGVADEEEAREPSVRVFTKKSKPPAPNSNVSSLVQQDLNLRWHFKTDTLTNLPSASRVTGILYFKQETEEEESNVWFEGIHLQGDVQTLTLYTAASYIHLGLETTTLNSEGNMTTIRGSFGGSDGLDFGGLLAPPPASSSSHNKDKKKFHPPLFPGCDHPIRIDMDLSTNTSTTSIVMHCNGNSTYKLTTQWEQIILDLPRTTDIAGYFSLLSIVETLRVGYLLTNLIPSSQQANTLVSPTTALAPLSLLCFTWIAITDFYILEVLLSAVWNVAGSKGFWTTAVLLKFFQFLVCHAPFLVLVFVAGFPNQNHDQVRQHFSNCLTRTQLALVFSLIAFELVRKSHPTVFALAFCSFWVPQIAHNISNNTDLFTVMSLWEVFDLSIQRALYPVLALSTKVLDNLAEVDQFGVHTEAKVHDPWGAVYCVLWMCVQLALLYSMHKRGARWFIPRFCFPKKYDYFAARRKSPVDDKEQHAKHHECAICMLPCEDEQVMVTPCQHMFHAKCLTTWMQVKLSCPTCRSDLPPL